MATITVEDGSIVTDATSYISVADFATYAANRGITLTTVTGSQDELLIRAMDYLESQSFIGTKSTSTQSLQWPRLYAYIDTYLVDSGTIPAELIKAQCEIAIAMDAGYSPISTLTTSVKSEQVGDIQVVYQDGASQAPLIRAVSMSLKKLVKGGSGTNTIAVSKA